MDFVKISFVDLQPEQKEILIAQLADAGYEGFEETESNLDAYINKQKFDKGLLHEMTYKYQTPFTSSTIAETNWNKLWESNFQPVIVGNFVGVRADFHSPIVGVDHEIVITPKMSFGTGHHATTYMMIELMQEIDFAGKQVMDFGTGTGILAILAEKLGAAKIVAIDNDDWSIENSKENIERNNCQNIHLRKASDPVAMQRFDVILANINKNVILENLTLLTSLLQLGGQMLFSGLLQDDLEAITESCIKTQTVLEKVFTRDNWIALKILSKCA